MKLYLILIVLSTASCSYDTLQRVCPSTCWPGGIEGPTVGICHAGRPICSDQDQIESCEGYQYPMVETCNGLDDDCDGNVDDGLIRECSTACGMGTEQCSWGQWVGCTAQAPTEEVCDYIDNDCDGQRDEDIYNGWTPAERVCYSGPAGTEDHPPCRYGLLNCVNGEVVCTGEITPWIEVCDGVDNNCNGQVDEGMEDEVPPPEFADTLAVTVQTDSNVLAQEILGPGVAIMTGSPSYTGGHNAAGLFEGGIAAGIGMESGIILTTGSVTNALPPNNVDNLGTNHDEPGDDDLDILVALGTFDATVLEFDFYMDGGDLYFSYVFASEEYNEFVNSKYNDVFAFFLDGINIALIPTTTTPVAINTINGGNPLGIDSSHPELFNNNDRSDGGPFYNIQYDGFTDVLVAAEFGLGAGIHHIKLAIADRGDRAFDSAVFIQGRSFAACSPE